MISPIATNNLEKTRKYTNRLSGVAAKTFIPKRNNPIASESKRRDDKGLNLAGGIGRYHIISQMTKKSSTFNSDAFDS
jgi:hypothetical protein